MNNYNFAGGRGDEGLNDLVREQRARIERAQAELGGASRPMQGHGMQAQGCLQAAQPTDPSRANSLFGAPPPKPAALAAPPNRGAPNDAQSRRDEMWERKRQQREQRLAGAGVAPGAGDGGHGGGGALGAHVPHDAGVLRAQALGAELGVGPAQGSPGNALCVIEQ